MDDKLGVYICTGYGIGDALDLEALTKVAEEEYSAALCKTISTCCEEDFEIIRNDVQSEELNKVVVAGASARLDHGIAPFGEKVIVEWVDLLHFAVLCQNPTDDDEKEDRQMMAEDYLRMGIVKAQKCQEIVPFEEHTQVDKTVMIVGGGITGMTAALESAKTGYTTLLVEKEAELGGWMAKWPKSIPTRAPYTELEDTGIADVIAEVQKNDKITVLTGTQIEKIEGGPGLLDVTFQSNNGSTAEPRRVGSIIQATGWKPFEPDGLEHLGFKQFDNVISNVRMEELAKSGKIARPTDGQAAQRVAFVQCAGSDKDEYFSYCSSIICLTALKQALYVREQDSAAKTYVFYDHLRAPGQYENFYKRAQQDRGIFLTKGNVKSVTENADKTLKLNVEDTMLGEHIEIEVDIVVLGLGMQPVSADSEAIRARVDAEASVAKAQAEGNTPQAEQLALLEGPPPGPPILNLDYRQGPDLPVLKHGYPDSHFICFPYETRRTGIYAAGCCRAPMEGLSCREDATGAALKAIQCVEMTSRGEAVHPRSGDQSFPEFFLQRCTQCKRCTEECPFGVLNEDTKGTPLPNATRCRRCGVCMGACPERIVSFKDYSVDMIASMIKAVEIPDEFDEKPRILCLACENDAYPALEMAASKGLTYSAFVRIIPLRCLGSMNIVWVADALSRGFDGIILMGCKFGDDYQCHFIRGSELANSRGENIKEKLTQLALEEERVELHEVEISDWETVPKIINDFAEVIEEVGMNPFKGM